MDPGRHKEFRTLLNSIHETVPQPATPSRIVFSFRRVVVALLSMGLFLYVCCRIIISQGESESAVDPFDSSSLPHPPSLISVSNIKEGETLRYPVALLCGGTNDFGDIRVINTKNSRPDGQNSMPITNGRFKILVELVPGINEILLLTSSARMSLKLNYKPMTTPYKVVFVYLVPDNGKSDPASVAWQESENFSENLSTSAKLLQTFMAERMNDAGVGRKTFNLEFNSGGQVLIHPFPYHGSKADLKSEVEKGLSDMYNQIQPQVELRYPFDRNQVVVFTSFEEKSARGVGLPGMALIGCSSIAKWPARLLDVRKAASDGLFAWHLGDMGCVLHELGHCFGCDHTAEKYSIMQANGGDVASFDGCFDFNRLFTITEPAGKIGSEECAFKDNQIAGWEPYLACHLYYTRWLQPDLKEFHEDRPITIRLNHATQEIVVKAPYGIGAVQFYGPPSNSREFAPPAKSQYEFFKSGPPKTRRYKLSSLHTTLETKDSVNIMVTDVEGNVETYKEADE